MIGWLKNRLLKAGDKTDTRGKATKKSRQKTAANKTGAPPQAVSVKQARHDENLKIIPRAEHGVSRQHIDESALKVLYRLNRAGFKACLVGGAVRDLLLRHAPKDFDVATDATPEQVAELFRNCRLIGRRFRLAHVQYGRKIIEVATFRAAHDDSANAHLNEDGRILRDNVYGDIGEDVWRRDFTVNALYYDISNFSVIDYVGGMEDIAAQRLRLIGDPETRYREDPVRMLRVVRFAAKLGFSIDESCRDFIYQNGDLLNDIPAARLYDETLKLFHTGHALASLRGLREYKLLQYLFPAAVDKLDGDAIAVKFLELAMQSTDARVHNELPITPAFLFSALLWAPLQADAQKRVEEGMPYSIAIQKAATHLLADQVRHVAIPRRFTTVMRDIWALQTRFGYRKGKRMEGVLTHPKFRAGYDFLCLRAQAGEPVQEDCEWWTRMQSGSSGTEEVSADTESTGSSGRRRRSPRKRRRRAAQPGS